VIEVAASSFDERGFLFSGECESKEAEGRGGQIRLKQSRRTLETGSVGRQQQNSARVFRMPSGAAMKANFLPNDHSPGSNRSYARRPRVWLPQRYARRN
jgi:hypothetical protein